MKSDSDNDIELSMSESSGSKKSEPSNDNPVDKENDVKKKKSPAKRRRSMEPKDPSKKKIPKETKTPKIKSLPAELPLQESSMQQMNTIATGGGTDGLNSSIDNLSDACFKEKISEILSGSDPNKITLNQVCDRVTEQFPDVDLVHKRQHIKSLVKQVGSVYSTLDFRTPSFLIAGYRSGLTTTATDNWEDCLYKIHNKDSYDFLLFPFAFTPVSVEQSYFIIVV